MSNVCAIPKPPAPFDATNNAPGPGGWEARFDMKRAGALEVLLGMARQLGHAGRIRSSSARVHTRGLEEFVRASRVGEGLVDDLLIATGQARGVGVEEAHLVVGDGQQRCAQASQRR